MVPQTTMQLHRDAHAVTTFQVGSGADLLKTLAELVVFGLPQVGSKADGCCASQPLRFCVQSCRYVCRAPQAWGECAYSQDVADTVCQPINLQNMTKNKSTDAWLEALQEACGSTDFPPQTRLFIAKTTNVRKVSSTASQNQSLEEVCFCLYDDESLEAYRQGILAHENKSS